MRMEINLCTLPSSWWYKEKNMKVIGLKSNPNGQHIKSQQTKDISPHAMARMTKRRPNTSVEHDLDVTDHTILICCT